MKGYKAFDKNLQCRGFQFAVGKTYTHKGDVVPCQSGFHFCPEIADVFTYYGFDNESTRLCEVEAVGEVVGDGDKRVTNKLKIVRELTWQDMLKLANTGKDNTGVRNSGHRNSSSRNSGDYNSGHRNSGDRNSGSRNSGNRNSGNYNSGYGNSGYYNSGYWNSGDRNSGGYNSGNGNSGSYNSGDWNSGHYNSGIFNTDEPPVRMFNKDTKLKRSQIDVPYIYLPVTEWVDESQMTDEQKKQDPQFHVKGGTLIRRDYKTAWGVAWERADENLKQRFLNLPNFNAKIFEEITGIKVEQPKKRKRK